MPSQNPGHVTVNRGTWSDTCTYESDLIANQAKKPAIRRLIEYGDRRMLTTLIASGAITPYGIDFTARTKFPKLDETKKVGNNAYDFDIMGRIERESVIIKQIGSSVTGGSFKLLMQDQYLYPGMIVSFGGAGRFQARVQDAGSGSPSSGFIYSFQNPSGETFSMATHVNTQPGSSKTCFGSTTTYGEGSSRGFSRDQYPDRFRNHTTISRATCAITGTAASQIVWYEYTNEAGLTDGGWMYEKTRQMEAKFKMQQEYAYLFGVSTMKNTDGTARATPTTFDENGNYVVVGDGLEEQIADGNVAYGSGINGEATEDDFADMMAALEQKSSQYEGCTWLVFTGTLGYANAQKKLVNLAGNQGITLMQSVTQSDAAGGGKVNVGYDFQNFNVNGNTVKVIKHTLLDDRLRFPAVSTVDGKHLMGRNYYFLNLGDGANKNIEIMAKAAYGYDREMVYTTIAGMTGGKDTAITEEDSKKYAVLSEKMLNVYNTQQCGIIYQQ